MDESRDMTFSELKEKDVVTVEGNNLGKPVDLVFFVTISKSQRHSNSVWQKMFVLPFSGTLYSVLENKKNRRRRYNRGRCALQKKGSIGQRSFLR